ncbi:hypothetical protein [Sulfitobacter sp. 1A15299]|uniref:hypothetical protein n=1 Tax=Sulfitobacter sp. 1A15299 TaxID=3368598 RepID=UPI00374A368F
MTALVGVVTYALQAERGRQHAILSERRALYLQYAEELASHMFKQININSEHHFARRDSLNKLGAKLSIVATDAIRQDHRLLIEHLRQKEDEADLDGNIAHYFDDEAQQLFDSVLSQMRMDALPKRIRARSS